MNDVALTDAEFDRLAELIGSVSGDKGMNLEQVDGYLAALLCTPTLVPISEYLPALFGAESMDEAGVAHANHWARAFLRGIAWDRQAWADLLGNADHGGAVLPMFALAHENDPDPALRHTVLDESKCDELMAYMIAGLVKAYAWFAPQRRDAMAAYAAPQRLLRSGPKVGRNEACPCGSGRKYRHCHGAT